MVFSSLVFLLYFLPATLIGYFLFSFSLPLQNVWLLIMSLVFYAWGEPSFIIIMLVSIIFNWLFGLFVGYFRDRNSSIAKIFVLLDVVLNVGLLFVFKYLGFFIDNINLVLGKKVINNPNLALPIGISFFTFQALSYVIDVYRKDAEVQKNILYMGLFISFFPQLVAGPIVRYNTIENYIRKRSVTIENIVNGTCRFSVGLIKKVLISNNLAVVVDLVFNLIKTGSDRYDMPCVLAWFATIGYAMQLFYDFSSYSDMAIGLGKIFGFEFEENFNYPYISRSVSEFWSRWHISLGTWFKEYVYFPLGGSRVENQDMMVRNTFVVWFLTGFWHGASWTYIIWGLYNFAFLIFERLIGYEKLRIPGWIKHILTGFVILMGMLFFRTDSLYLMREAVKDLFMVNGNSFCNATALWTMKEYLLVFIIGIVFCSPTIPQLWERLTNSKNSIVRYAANFSYCLIMCAGVSFATISLVRGGYNPFIYFNF